MIPRQLVSSVLGSGCIEARAGAGHLEEEHECLQVRCWEHNDRYRLKKGCIFFGWKKGLQIGSEL